MMRWTPHPETLDYGVAMRHYCIFTLAITRGIRMDITLIGIDLAKNIFQVCRINQAGRWAASSSKP